MQHKGVTVTTIAAAKGLQFPIVVVSGMEKNFAPGVTSTDEISANDKARKKTSMNTQMKTKTKTKKFRRSRRPRRRKKTKDER